MQMSSRPPKAALDKTAAEAQPLPLAAPAGAREDGGGANSGAADLALIWTLQGPEGQPSRLGAHHLYELREKVGTFSLNTAAVQPGLSCSVFEDLQFHLLVIDIDCHGFEEASTVLKLP